MARGGYTPEEIRNMTELEIQFLSHYQVLLETDHQKFWTDCLGVIWEADEFNKPKPVESQSDNVRPNRLFIPLLQGINPDILTVVKENFGLSKEGKKRQAFVGGGDYIPKAGENIVSMASLSKDEFKKKMGVR